MPDKKQIPVKYNKDFKIFFTDIVKIDVNPETVSLTFGIKSGEKAEIEVTHRAIMTLPHNFDLLMFAIESLKTLTLISTTQIKKLNDTILRYLHSKPQKKFQAMATFV